MTLSKHIDLLSRICAVVDSFPQPNRRSTLESCSLAFRNFSKADQPFLLHWLQTSEGDVKSLLRTFKGVSGNARNWVKRLAVSNEKGKNVRSDYTAKLLLLFPCLEEIWLSDIDGGAWPGFDLAALSSSPALEALTIRHSSLFSSLDSLRLSKLTCLVISASLMTATCVLDLLCVESLPSLCHLAILDNTSSSPSVPLGAWLSEPQQKRLRYLFYRLRTLVLDIRSLTPGSRNPIQLHLTSTHTRLLVDCKLSQLAEIKMCVGFVSKLRVWDDVFRSSSQFSSALSSSALAALAMQAQAILSAIEHLTHLLKTRHPLFRNLRLLLLPPFLDHSSTSLPPSAQKLLEALIKLCSDTLDIEVVYEDRDIFLSPYFAKHSPAFTEREEVSNRGGRTREKPGMTDEGKRALWKEWDEAREEWVAEESGREKGKEERGKLKSGGDGSRIEESKRRGV